LTSEANDDNQAAVRLARAEDAERIAVLCQQLGYPASQEEVQRRLNRIQRDKQHVVYVAKLSDGHVIGWVHVHVRQLIVADLQAEIGGLIVDEDYRHCGVGRLLMQQAEQWAREKGCWTVYLRSNVVRKDAHAFYEGIGYSNVKASMSFRKAL
jgi:GNAT superfamily N-acetyltransferase